jgi:hypothetical protein
MFCWKQLCHPNKPYPVPVNLNQLRAFLGRSGYYRRFVKDYSRIASPLYERTKKNANCIWTEHLVFFFKLEQYYQFYLWRKTITWCWFISKTTLNREQLLMSFVLNDNNSSVFDVMMLQRKHYSMHYLLLIISTTCLIISVLFDQFVFVFSDFS